MEGTYLDVIVIAGLCGGSQFFTPLLSWVSWLILVILGFIVAHLDRGGCGGLTAPLFTLIGRLVAKLFTIYCRVAVGEHWGDARVSLQLIWVTWHASIISAQFDMNSGISAADLDVGRQKGPLFLYSWLLYWVDLWEFIAVFFCTGVDRVWMLSIAATDCSLARLICFMGCIGEVRFDLDRMQVSWQEMYYLVWIDRLQTSNNKYNEWLTFVL